MTITHGLGKQECGPAEVLTQETRCNRRNLHHADTVPSNVCWRQALCLLRLLAVIAVALASGWAAAHDTPTEAVFGPKIHTRTNGPVTTVTDSFTIPADVTAPYRLRIESGSVAVPGAKRVTAVKIEINGDEVLDSDDLRGNAAVIEKSVRLRDGLNRLSVGISGTAGSALRLRIRGTPKPTVPTSLSPNPLTLSAGATDKLTATLSPPPRSAGVLIATSCERRIASVPRRIPFSAGQISVEVPVTGLNRGRTTIRVSLENRDYSGRDDDRRDNSGRRGGDDRHGDDDDDDRGSARTTVNVIDSAPPTLASLLPSALTLTQGASGSLTLTLNIAAAANTNVPLTSSEPGVARVPASIVDPAGQQRGNS